MRVAVFFYPQTPDTTWILGQSFPCPSREPEAGAVKGVVYIDKEGYNPVIQKAIGGTNANLR